jgi:hypothetical protein
MSGPERLKADIEQFSEQINACTHASKPEYFGFWEKMCMIQWVKRYPVHPTYEQIKDGKLYLKWRAHNLGCIKCAEHMLEYMKLVKPTMKSRVEAVWWLHGFFNSINRRLGCPEMTREEFMRVHISTPPTVEHMNREYQRWQQLTVQSQAQ